MLVDEPARGSIPPPWFASLPGIDRIRACANGQLPLPPLFHLLGIRPGHVGSGSGTWTMPDCPRRGTRAQEEIGTDPPF